MRINGLLELAMSVAAIVVLVLAGCATPDETGASGDEWNGAADSGSGSGSWNGNYGYGGSDGEGFGYVCTSSGCASYGG